MFELRARQKELTFTYHQSVAEEVDSGQGFPLMIKADERRLRQLLLNLLSNAVKFTEHGHISLRVIYQNTVMRVEIEDSGCGISAAEQQIIFEPFKQLGAQKQAEGTGLGLSISQRLSDLMGGTLSARSTPGQGSMFWFEMPLTVIQWQQDMPPHIEMPIANRRITGHTGECQRILVVDDIASNRELLIEMLKPLGFEIAEAEDGKEALLVAEVFVPHVVIIDLRMPEMDGIECVKRLRSQPLYQDTVIFMLSASVQEIHKKDCLTAGCNAFLEKPLHLDTLLNSLEQHCQLQWIDANDSTVTETAHVTFPKEIQQRLQGFLEQGKVQEIINYLEQLDDPEMQPGKNKALDLAKRFELNKLKILLDFSS
jgi:CheY-like chemotaxis protein